MSDSVQSHRWQPTRLPLSLGFSRQEQWSRLPFPSPIHESGKVEAKSLSRVRLLATPWTAAYQAPPSMAFSRQEYWSGVPLPSPWLSILNIAVYTCPSQTNYPFPLPFPKSFKSCVFYIGL